MELSACQSTNHFLRMLALGVLALFKRLVTLFLVLIWLTFGGFDE